MRHPWLALCCAIGIPGCAAPRVHPSDLADRAAPSSHSVRLDWEVPPGDPTPPVSGLAELEQLAVSRHGDLERLRLERRAFEARAVGARAWPDPRLIFREYLVEVETRVGPQERTFGIEQTIPWPGLLDDRSERASRQAEMTGYELLGARREVLARLRSRWAEYFYLGRAIVVRRETLALLGRLQELARDRLAVGRGSASHVIRVQVELARLENEIATLVERTSPLRTSILSLVGGSPDREIPFPVDLDPREPEPTDPDRIRENLLDRDAVLARADAAIRVAEAELDIAGYEGWPKLGIGAQTIITGDAVSPGVSGSGDDAWIVGVQLEIPIDRRRVRAAERSARDHRDGAVAAARQLERDRVAVLEDALFLREDAARRVGLYDGTLIPKGEESLRATEAAFVAGEVDFTNLIDAERVLLEFRLSLERARADRWLAGARLRGFLGEPDSWLEVERTEEGSER